MKHLQLKYNFSVDQITKNEWSDALNGFSDANFYQTWSYGALKWKMGQLSHLVLKKDGEIAAVAYSKKFKGVFNSIDIGNYVIDARETETQQAIDKIVSMFGERAQIKEKLQIEIEMAKKGQMDIFQQILNEKY